MNKRMKVRSLLCPYHIRCFVSQILRLSNRTYLNTDFSLWYTNLKSPYRFFFPADMTDDPLTTTTYLETTPFFHLYKLFF